MEPWCGSRGWMPYSDFLSCQYPQVIPIFQYFVSPLRLGSEPLDS